MYYSVAAIEICSGHIYSIAQLVVAVPVKRNLVLYIPATLLNPR